MNAQPNYCYRFIGGGPADGILMRVVTVDQDEVIAVQDSPQPRFSWLGTRAEFAVSFAFVYGPALVYYRG